MNRAGEYVENMSGKALYKSFRPSPLAPELNIDERMTELLIKAIRNLAELNAVSKLIPDTGLFVSMYVRKEALISSQIEGTQCTFDDILDPDETKNTNLDVADVVNYVRAVYFARRRLDELPLCNRLIKEIHAVLMNGIRGQEKNPGEFRRSQNWIGQGGCSLKDARYIPPSPEDMEKAMGELEKYINEDGGYDPIIKAGLIHYQFETIHPFLDGNGRIGRLLILLYLKQKNLITEPVLYVSYFLKKNQVEYYDRISEVRRTGNYEQWINFFLEAVSAAAEDAVNSINLLLELHNKNISLLEQTGNGKNNVRRVFDYLEKSPVIDIKKTADELDLSYNTVSAAVKKLINMKILSEHKKNSRSRSFSYDEYIDILRKDT